MGSLKAGFGRNKEIFSSSHWNGSCRLEDNWSTSWPYASGNFSSFFSRNRFSQIMRFLHLNDSAHYIPKQGYRKHLESGEALKPHP